MILFACCSCVTSWCYINDAFLLLFKCHILLIYQWYFSIAVQSFTVMTESPVIDLTLPQYSLQPKHDLRSMLLLNRLHVELHFKDSEIMFFHTTSDFFIQTFFHGDFSVNILFKSKRNGLSEALTMNRPPKPKKAHKVSEEAALIKTLLQPV